MSLRIEWADELFDLLPDRAVSWPARSTLIVADVHFGKADHFRQAGVPVPSGTTEANLQRLDALLDSTRARRLLVLGDLVHAKTGCTPSMLAQLAVWRARRADLEIVVVRGNHDGVDPPPAALRVDAVHDELVEGQVQFQHAPPDECGRGQSPRFVMAGHLHPAVWLHGRARPSTRTPCFHFAQDVAVLPAFGAFTGMHPIRPRRGDRVFAVGPSEVVEVTPRPPKQLLAESGRGGEASEAGASPREQ